MYRISGFFSLVTKFLKWGKFVTYLRFIFLRFNKYPKSNNTGCNFYVQILNIFKKLSLKKAKIGSSQK